MSEQLGDTLLETAELLLTNCFWTFPSHAIALAVRLLALEGLYMAHDASDVIAACFLLWNPIVDRQRYPALNTCRALVHALCVAVTLYSVFLYHHHHHHKNDTLLNATGWWSRQ
jgi:hypothetical protein